MLISSAFAATAADNTVHLDALSEAPTAFQSFATTLTLTVVLMALFYLLLIMPQQRRFKEHNKMLNTLKKGDRIVTGGGLVGKIEKIIDDHEVVIDLGNDIKVTALRSTIQNKSDAFMKSSSSSGSNDKSKKETLEKENKGNASKTKAMKKASGKEAKE